MGILFDRMKRVWCGGNKKQEEYFLQCLVDISRLVLVPNQTKSIVTCAMLSGRSCDLVIKSTEKYVKEKYEHALLVKDRKCRTPLHFALARATIEGQCDKEL